jgi:hypothetical protein
MCMLTRRLQILLDEAQYSRLESYAKERRLSVGAAVREALDKAIPSGATRRRAAGKAILSAPRMRIGSIEELKKDLDDIRAGAHD